MEPPGDGSQDTITLWVKHRSLAPDANQRVDDGIAMSLTTDSITVGTPFDQSVFSVPAGIVIKHVPDSTAEDEESTAGQDDSDDDE